MQVATQSALRLLGEGACAVVLSQERDCFPGVQYANVHTEQRYFIYFMSAQRWVLGGNSIKLAHYLQNLPPIYLVTGLEKPV